MMDRLEDFESKVSDVCKLEDKIPRGDLQGVVEAVAMNITDDFMLRHEISNEILIIIDECELKDRDDAIKLLKERILKVFE